ncbi:MAG: DNA polymerase III subunit alpha [Pseudomonadota bacterium]|nr:DNA polymerase III subunit alpha [Pseudomonadota bacterium]
MKPQFIHLRVHTEYSLSDGIVRIPKLVEKCVADEMPAVAVTDLNNLFGLIKFYNNAEASGVKPIVASDVWIADSEGTGVTPLVLIAKNNIGYLNLCQLISATYSSQSGKFTPSISRHDLKKKSDGLIALSGGKEGDIGKALLVGNWEGAIKRLAYWSSIFPSAFYIEIQRTGREYEKEYNASAIELAAQEGIPVVATNDVRFLARDEFEAHEARVCIYQGRVLDDSRRQRVYSEEQYLKSSEEMHNLFSDVPEAIENCLEIGKRCSVNIELGKYYFPDYGVPSGETSETFLDKTAKSGLTARLKKFGEKKISTNYLDSDYQKRLEFELSVINKMGFADYFLIVMEFISWAKANQIPVGPGRGSGAGSLVAYALEITDIDPLQYDLLFERFLNPERVSLPDFDIDFCIEGRDRVIQHVIERYGKNSVSQIITFGTMAAKAVVRDVARVQGKPYALADKLSKMIPFEPGMTLTDALRQEPLLDAFVAADEDAQEIMEMALKLEGLTRNVGRHAGGVVIAPCDLTNFTPTYCDEPGAGLMTQFDMIDVEKAGLVKFDFLGLRTLTIVDNTVRNVNQDLMKKGQPPIILSDLDLESKEVYKNLQQSKTTAVFQLESRGMKDLMRKVRPNCFNDIVALVALFRPGPMQLAEDFINRKHGKEKVDFLHPSLKHVLEDTYGVMLYQEQVMQIAQVLAGYSLADADLLRRAMGKKKPEEMAQQRANFVAGAQMNGVDDNQANYIFGLMEKFAGYGFNKPHSVAYALIAYQTAWLKHFHTSHFMAAVLSSEMQNTDKILLNIEECRRLEIEIKSPDVNEGDYRFKAETDGSIRYGLGAIKGLGEGSIESLVNSREKEGKFVDLFDFFQRVDNRKVNKRSIEALISSGGLDSLISELPEGVIDHIGYKRALLLMVQEDAIKLSEQQSLDEAAGNTDLFASDETSSGRAVYALDPEDVKNSISMKIRLEKEKESLGLFLSGHPVDQYEEEFSTFVGEKICDLRAKNTEVMIGGQITEKRITKNKRGETQAFIMLDDKTARIEISIFADLFMNNSQKIDQDRVVFVKGTVSEDSFSGGLRVRGSEVLTIQEVRNRFARSMLLDIEGGLSSSCSISDLKSILSEYRLDSVEACAVRLRVSLEEARGEIALGKTWKVRLEDSLLEVLRKKLGQDAIHLNYR